MKNKNIIGLGISQTNIDDEVFINQEFLDGVIKFIKTKVNNNEQVVIYGHRGSGKILINELKKCGQENKIARHYDKYHEEFNLFNKQPEMMPLDGKIDYVIVCFYQNSYRQCLRYLFDNFGVSNKIVLPFFNKENYSEKEFENKNPIFIYSPARSGSFRFMPAMHYFLKLFERKHVHFDTFLFKKRFIHNHLMQGEKKLNQDYVDNRFMTYINDLDYYEYAIVHGGFPSFKYFKDIKDINFVLLLRDPRDVINSFYFNLYGSVTNNSQGHYIGVHDESLQEKRLLEIINGKSRIYNNYFSIWPSIKKIVNNYLEVLNFSNVYIIKYEDIHKNAQDTYLKVLDWLCLTKDFYMKNKYFEFNQDHLNEGIKLGSFEYQTNNQRKRGEDYNYNYMKSGIQTSCRKGIVGDWKNNFSVRVKDKFKEVAGEALIKLGYEKDLNW